MAENLRLALRRTVTLKLFKYNPQFLWIYSVFPTFREKQDIREKEVKQKLGFKRKKMERIPQRVGVMVILNEIN